MFWYARKVIHLERARINITEELLRRSFGSKWIILKTGIAETKSSVCRKDRQMGSPQDPYIFKGLNPPGL